MRVSLSTCGTWVGEWRAFKKCIRGRITNYTQHPNFNLVKPSEQESSSAEYTTQEEIRKRRKWPSIYLCLHVEEKLGIWGYIEKRTFFLGSLLIRWLNCQFGIICILLFNSHQKKVFEFPPHILIS